MNLNKLSKRVRKTICFLPVFLLLFPLAAISQADTTITKTTMDNKKKVTGIGGIFFKCQDPKKMLEWYGQNLGLETTPYGVTFEFLEADKPEEKAQLQWNPFAATTTYFAPSQKDFMINYRVQNLEELVAELRATGVIIVDEIAAYDYGKFVHIMDPEGNKIELWEAVNDQAGKPGEKPKPAQGIKATGIGGIFFKCENTENMRDWYNKNLGFNTNEYGAMFEFRELDKPVEIAYLQWSPFSVKTKYFEPSTKQLMINYRVENMEELVNELKANGVTVLDEIETFEYGKFVHIMDPEGNKIELWEAVDKVFTEMNEEQGK